MKTLTTVSLMALLGFGISAAGSTSLDPVKTDVQQTASDTEQLANESKEDFLKRMEALRADFEVRIVQLEKRIESMDAESRKVADKRLQALRRQVKGLDQRLKFVKNDSGEKWRKLRGGINQATKDLKRACDDLSKSLK